LNRLRFTAASAIAAQSGRAALDYLDRFLRTEQGWRFVSRSFDQLFVRQISRTHPVLP
jgi:hypothetical protein